MARHRRSIAHSLSGHEPDDVLTGLDRHVVAVFHAHPDDEVFTTGWSYLTRPGQWIDTTESSRTLAAAPTEAVATAVRAVIDAWQPRVVLSVGPDGLTGHPDHIAMHDAVAAALRLPGWSPREAWGAVLVDADVRAATTLIEQLRSDDDHQRPGHANVTGVSASQITRSIHSPGTRAARQQAMDLYLDGLGNHPLDRLINERGLRGASLILRAVFDVAGWETDGFVRL